MDERERAALEAAGFRIGDAEDFLELTDEERRLVELRVAVSRAVRARREEQGLTQEQVAKKLKTSQPRVAMIEAGASAVSLDSMFRGLFVLGGSVNDLQAACSAPPAKQAGPATSRAAARPRSGSYVSKASKHAAAQASSVKASQLTTRKPSGSVAKRKPGAK